MALLAGTMGRTTTAAAVVAAKADGAASNGRRGGANGNGKAMRETGRARLAGAARATGAGMFAARAAKER